MPRLRTVEAIPLSYAMFGILDLYPKLRLIPESVYKKSLSHINRWVRRHKIFDMNISVHYNNVFYPSGRVNLQSTQSWVLSGRFGR